MYDDFRECTLYTYIITDYIKTLITRLDVDDGGGGRSV